MATKTGLAEGKKRYYLSLTEVNMVAFKEIMREFNAPLGLESIIVDEYIAGFVKHIAPVIRKAKKDGKVLTVVDFFVLAGNVMQELQNDEQGSLL